MNIKLRRILLLTCLVLVSLGCNFVTVIAPTATPEPTPTITSTPEPKPTATNTTQPSPAGIPDDWQLFTAEGMEIWLPASYVGGNLEEDLPVVIETMRTLGPEYEEMADTIEQNPDLYVIIAADSNVTSSGFLTNITIAAQPVLSSLTLETYLNALEQQFPSGYRILESSIIELGEYEAGRMIVETEILNANIRIITFLVMDENDLWMITFTTEAGDFDELLPVFEQSASTFRILP